MLKFCEQAIIAALGFVPAPGYVVNVPRAEYQKATLTERAKAKTCAALYGIKWRIVKDGPAR